MPTHELVDLTVDRVAGVDKAANGRTFLIIKRADDDMTDDDRTSLATIQTTVAALQETVAKMSDGMDDEKKKKKKKDEEMMKGADIDIPADVQKRLDEQATELKKRDDRIAALEAESLQKRWTDAVRDQTGVKKSDDLVTELVAIEKSAGKDAAEKMLARLATLQKQADEAGLLTELGSARSGEEIPVHVKIDTEVAKRMEAHPELNRADVYTAVMKAHATELAGRG